MEMDNENLDRKFDFASFSRASSKMIATNDVAYKNRDKLRRDRTRDYTDEEIENIISNGTLRQQQELSRNYFNRDGFYRRLIIYYSTILKYCGLLVPYQMGNQSLSNSKLQKRYQKAVEYVEAMRLPEFLTNCSQSVFLNGGYYGIKVENNNKNCFTVIDLPCGYATSTLKDYQGNDIIEFDIRYFDTIRDEKKRKMCLSTYPKVVTKAYKDYKNGKLTQDECWIIIPSELGICFPLFDGRPMFLSVIPATIHYDIAVDTDQEKALDEISKIIVQQMPHLNDGRLVFEPDEAAAMHAGAVKMLKGQPNVSVITSYADVEAITSKSSADNSNTTLERMLNNIYNKAGVSNELFRSTGSSTLKQSLQNDLSLVMYIAQKYDKYITNHINMLFSNSGISFKYQTLPVSYYNDSEYIDETFKLASSGYSFLLPMLALGFSQRDLSEIKTLENDILKLGDKLIPLASSYTQTGDGAGRPALAEDEKSEKTLENEKSIENQNSGGSN